MKLPLPASLPAAPLRPHRQRAGERLQGRAQGLLARLLQPFASPLPVSAAGVPAPLRRVALVEEYEARLMYSADLAATGLALAGTAQVTQQRVVDDSGEFVQAAQATRHELLIVGAGIEDSQSLLASLDTQGREIEVVTLDPERDSIDQISTLLASRHDLDAIHVLSHGAEGQLDLGQVRLDAATMAARSDEIASWGNALTAGGDLLLYGCDVAAGETGLAFVARLASLTGADVAASNDLTGDASGAVGQAGNWNLEVQTGRIETATAFSAAAQASWTGTLETRVNDATSGVQSAPAVAINASGESVVTWTTDNDGSGSGIMMQRYKPNGSADGGQIHVNTDTNGEQVDSAVGIDNNGRITVVWTSRSLTGSDTSGTSIQGQRYDANGNAAGSQFVVNQGIAGDQDLAAISVNDNGQIVVAWQNADLQQVFVRRFDVNGMPLTGDIAVDDSSTIGQQRAPAVAFTRNNSFVVAWQSNTGAIGDAIFARMFDSNAAPVAAKFQVNFYDLSDQREPAIAANSSGVFVISYTSAGQLAGLGVYSSLYNADGTLLGGGGASDYSSDQSQSNVGISDTGIMTYVATSNDTTGADSDGTGVYRFETDTAGNARYGPALVNTTITGNQSAPVVAVNHSGAVVVVWQGNGFGDDQGIFRRSFQNGNGEVNANPDAASVQANVRLVSPAHGVLVNDHDDEGETINVVQIVDASGNAAPVPAAGVSIAGQYGTLFIQADGYYTYDPRSNAAAAALALGQTAKDVFIYAASDGVSSGTSTTLTFTVTGVNNAPTAVADAYAIDQAYLGSGVISVALPGLLANDLDADSGETLSVFSVSYNGTSVSAGTPLATQYGSVTVRSDGSLAYTLYNKTNLTVVNLTITGGSLVDQFSYTIKDSKGALSTSTVAIKIQSAPRDPVANSDSYSIDEGMALNIPAASGVLLNDADGNNDVLHAVVVSNVAHGTLVLKQDGSFVYTPDAAYHGPDAFTYRVSDGNAFSNTATVTLNVNHINHAPVAVGETISVLKNATVDQTAGNGLLSNDSDSDANPVDTLVVSSVRTTAGGSANSVQVSSSTGASIVTNYGTLMVRSNGSYTYIANRSASLALLAGQNSSDIFSYTISDGHGGSATAVLKFVVNGSNTAPAITGTVANQDVDDDDTITPFATVSVNDVDGSAQVLTLTVKMDDNTHGSFTSSAGFTYNAGNDSYSIMGFGAQITNALRAMVFTPAENRVAAGLAETTRFTLTATDQIQPTTDSVTTVRSKSINDAPVINGVQAAQASSDKLAISPFANVTFTDADRPGQTLDIVVKLGRSDVGTLANLGAFTYDTASQSYLYSGTAAQASLLVQAIRFVPINNRAAPGQVDNTVLTLSASDRLAARMIATTTIAITSEDDAPTIAGITTAAQAVRSGGAINPFATVAIGDADDPAQILTVHVTLSERANGVLSQLGAGQYNSATGDYVLYATAADATATLQGLVFTATPGQLAPVASASTRFSLNVDDNTFSQSNQDTVVVATGQNTPPVITGSSGAQDIDDDTSVHPFASLVISDADVPVQMLTASVTLDHPGQGSLRGFTRGAFDQSTGVYSVSGLASDVSAALQELEFVPQPNRLAPGSTETTVLRIDLSDGYQAVVDASTSVRSRSVNDAPTISGMPGMQDISDKQTLHPFANVAIDDADGAFQTLSVTVKLDHAVLGELSTTGDGHYDSASGLYHVSGSAAQVTAALQALTLTPTQNRMAPGASEPALLTLSVNDGTDATTLSSVVSITSVDDAPVATPLTINGASSTAGVVALDLHATDVDDAVVSFTLAGLPGGGTLFADADGTVAVVAGSGMTALNGGLRLYFKPQTGFGGTTQFSYVATDLAGNSSTMQAVVQLILIVPPPPATASAPEPVAAQSPVAPQAAAAPVVQLANGAAVSAASLARNVAGTSEGAAATPSSSTATLVTVGAQMPMQMVPQVDAAGAAVQVTLEGRSAAAAQAGYERVIEDNAASNVTIRGIAASSNVPIVLAPLALQPSANASLNLLDTQASAQTRAAVDSSTEAPEMIGSLDNLRKSAQLSSVQQEQIVESTVAASTAVTVGYVLWLLRGGVLAASMLTALPAWRFVDPLPVLGGLKNDDDAADDDSLEKLVAEGGETGEGGGLPCNPHGNFDGDLHGSDAGDADPVAKPGPYGHGSEIAMRTT